MAAQGALGSRVATTAAVAVVDNAIAGGLESASSALTVGAVDARDIGRLPLEGIDVVVSPSEVGAVDIVRLCRRSGVAPVIVVRGPGQALRAAAAGTAVLAADAPRQSVEAVVVGAVQGRTLWAPTAHAVAAPTPRRLPLLTPREAQVLNEILDGHSPGSIAGRLVVSPETVKTHTRSLLRKFAVTDRTALVCRAFGHLTAIGDPSTSAVYV